ncbi:glycosyltransferase family 4 protein [Acidobacteriota bacterium]
MDLTVGIDCQRLAPGGRGIDRYLSVLVRSLGNSLKYLQLNLYYSGEASHLEAYRASNVSIVPKGLGLRMQYRPGVGPFLRFFLGKIDVFHFPGPDVWYSKRCPTLVSIHDLVHFRYPERFFSTSKEEKDFRAHMHRIRDNADMIATGSEFSKKDIVNFLDISEDRVRVIPDAVDERFRPYEPGEEERARILERFGVDGNYVLFVGGNDFRKNLKATVEAMALLDAKGSLDCQLLVVGAFGRGPVFDDIENLPAFKSGFDKGKIRLTGRVDDQELLLLYSCAELFIFPSLFEGFGYPPLEAMACGAPVITSNRGALGEVLEDAAWFVDPENPEEIAGAIQTLVSDTEARQRKTRLGLSLAGRYSGQTMAQAYARLYRETAGPTGD